MEDTFLVQTPEALKAIAHPLRQRILMDLVVAGHARAADLARSVDAPANSVSFHLRTLAKAGMVVEAPELARDGRDRVWRPVAENFRVEPGTAGTATEILRPALAWVERLFTTANDGGPADEGTKRRALVINNVSLTPDEARAFRDELVAFHEKWADRAFSRARQDPDAPRDAYQVLLALGPRDEG
ncbi:MULTISPECIES: helix-turn-helix transcriptional regulator [Isoptericola]|uniref:Helix-turn-helix transcriptional regulator n=1 Tax=Isoptericola sediminis TaxID=2733572 RepID=A0A849K398_9MICO|nr:MULTISPECIES: helix-turn-helix domain-containing protein [Isoptericola]MDO8143084.1 helix-turn-helix domain-containing protein [Isoptericola sp. 178]MDO8146945.1 helix-turn-helix domain-containing protein [Isoptericola sp. b515]NNU26810.1 helix-turn-helix transcriptional regulator [Isoptericola sediminis]